MVENASSAPLRASVNGFHASDIKRPGFRLPAIYARRGVLDAPSSSLDIAPLNNEDEIARVRPSLRALSRQIETSNSQNLYYSATRRPAAMNSAHMLAPRERNSAPLCRIYSELLCRKILILSVSRVFIYRGKNSKMFLRFNEKNIIFFYVAPCPLRQHCNLPCEIPSCTINVFTGG